MIKIRKIDNAEEYLQLFNDEHFYLGSKRPSSLNNAQRENILSNSYVIYLENVEIGYIFLNKKSKYYAAISIIVCKSDILVTDKMDYLVKSAIKYFNETEKCDETYLYVEGYSSQILKYCQNSTTLENVGCLRNNVYKLGCYFNSYVFKIKESYYGECFRD
jgi:hypothetical protein